MSLPASTAHLAAVTILTMWAESSTGMTGVLTIPREINARVDLQKRGTNLVCAAEIRSSAKCAEEIAVVDTLRLAKFKEETTGDFGAPMMKAHATRITAVNATLRDQPT